MKIGFIGAGNMGCAIMRGAFQGGFLKPYETMVYDVSEQQLAALTAAYPVNVAENNIQIARECEFIILAIKPIYMRGVLEEIQKYCYNKKIISIAAGWSMAGWRRLYCNLRGKQLQQGIAGLGKGAFLYVGRSAGFARAPVRCCGGSEWQQSRIRLYVH